jgi:hypothetical protein
MQPPADQNFREIKKTLKTKHFLTFSCEFGWHGWILRYAVENVQIIHATM